MKKVYLTIMMMTLALSACTSTTSPTPIPTITLGDDSSPSNTNQSSTGNSVSAAAVVVPTNDAQLSFSAIGRVTAVNVKIGDKVSAGDILVQLDTTLQEAKVREAEANLLAAQIQFNYQKRLGVDEVHIQTAEAEIARTQALLDSANAMLASQFTLTAPFNGTIVSVDIAPAETVVPGQVVIVLGDLSRYQIETTDLSERDIPKVQIGQSASIFIEALDEEFTGRVIDIDRIGSTLGGDVVYTVTIAFAKQPQGLLWGMSADVEIQTAE
ncbi:MAG TPA: efflux RND transporter periplasmic adaptor subunit [Anaerolineales bacterium]